MSYTVSAKPSFEPCPEGNHKAVLVDVTPLKTYHSEYGDRECHKLVFEAKVGAKWYLIFSKPLTPSLHEKAALRAMVVKLLGRQLTKTELDGFDLETLIGTCVSVEVEHATTDKGTYANIAFIKRISEDVETSGDYVRIKDRDSENGEASAGGKEKQTEFRSTGGKPKSTKAQKPDDVQDPGSIRVHIGRFAGQELSDLSREDIQKLIEFWLERDFPKIAKPTADDKRLASALRQYKARFEKEDKEAEGGDGDGEPPDDLEY